MNEPPVKEIAHDFDEFMIAVLEECFEKETCVYQAIPTATSTTTAKINQLPMTIPEPVDAATSVVAGSKIKLFVGSSPGDAVKAFNGLVETESFVSPLCFDCRDDLSVMGRVLRAFTEAFPPRLNAIPLLNSSLIGDVFAQYIRDYLECLQEQRIELDSAKALYCISLIAFCNVYRQAAISEGLPLQSVPYFAFDDFVSVVRVAQQSSPGDDRSELDLICSAAIDSYTRLPAHEQEASAQVNHLIELFFAADSSLQLRRACAAGLSAALALFDGAFAVFILEQSMNRCLQTGTARVNKATAALLLSALQFSPALSGHLNFILNYLWKGDGTELPKGAGLFAAVFEEALNCAFNAKWSVSASVCNQCCLQMFHALLKTEDSAKGAILLKLRFLDQLTTAATVLSASGDQQPPTSRGLMAAIEGTFVSPACPANSSSLEALKRIPERVAGLLIKLISGEAAQLRSKAIKNLYVLMSSTVLDSSSGVALKQSILNRLSDPSISVRDAVLEFVSKLLLDSKGPVSIDALSSVLSRIKVRQAGCMHVFM